MDSYQKREIQKDLVKQGSEEYKAALKFKDMIVNYLWDNKQSKGTIKVGDYYLEIGLYSGEDKHEFKRSGERVFREICFKHTDEGCDYWVPIEKAMKYHPLNVKLKGRSSKTNMIEKDDYFIVRKAED